MPIFLLLFAAVTGTLLAPLQAGELRPARPDLYLYMDNPDLLDEGVYIVQLAAPPVLNYRGSENGPAQTQPQSGERFDPDAHNVRQYARQLTDSHDTLLHSIGAYQGKLYSYRYTFNGFAARMTAAQAQKLQNQRSVLRVWKDQVRYLQTSSSPAFIGLLDQNGGLRTDLGLQGENIVIGVIDSGIAPDHPSFRDHRDADRPRLCQTSWSESSLLGLWLCKRFRNKSDVPTFQPPENWNGACETGTNFSSTDCNNKIIGARYYVDGFLETQFLDENEFISPRDADGHGTHIASTAAGIDVPASIANTSIARVTGMAPRARIAVYKACWLEPGQIRGSCNISDLQRAIEDAVADGVDIINYSIGNTDISIVDPDDLALLAASNAGVLSVVAAGNDGPDPLGNILSPSGAPWVLTVAASSRRGSKSEEALRVDAPTAVANNYVTREAGFTPPLRDVGPITAELVLVDDGSGVVFDACETIENTAEIADKIAFLQRGACDFEVKLINAETAGAVAAVVFDNQGEPIIMAGTRGSVNIPAVMISQADGQLLLGELQNDAVVELTLDKSIFINEPDNGDVMGSFSSTGPNLTAPDILKPDITAPGVDILAGHTPTVANGIRGENFQYLSGTSMAVPHIAGVAALLKEANPDWSPAAIKSALMTTARQNVFKQDGAADADPFDFGSGHVVPNSATNPGLIYEAGKDNYNAFTCGTEVPRVSQDECDALIAGGLPTLPADLNLPSIAVSSLVSGRVIKRQVTNVGQPTQYHVSVESPPGIDLQVNPEVLSVGAGETVEYEVILASNSAEPYVWQFGALTWEDGEHSVRSPIAVRPVPFIAPLEVSADGTTGNVEFNIEFGYSGDYVATAHGLVPADQASDTVQDDPLNSYEFQPDNSLLPGSIRRFEFSVEENQSYLRVATFDEDTSGEDDLDLYVYRCLIDGDVLSLCSSVGFSGTFQSDEQIDVLYPLPGLYIVDVHGFDTQGGLAADFTLSVWQLGADDNRMNMNITAPTVAVPAVTDTITASWSGLDSARYLGGITHANGPGIITEFNDDRFLEFTLIEVNH
jgi:subtilisin family serine protease